QAHHHRKGARAQHQVDAGGGHHADRAGDEKLHQACSLGRDALGSTSIAVLLIACGFVHRPIRDRLASASITAPTTVRNTPVSKAIALASSNSPTSGRWK